MKKNPKADNTNCTRDRNDDFDLETAGERTRELNVNQTIISTVCLLKISSFLLAFLQDKII